MNISKLKTLGLIFLLSGSHHAVGVQLRPKGSGLYQRVSRCHRQRESGQFSTRMLEHEYHGKAASIAEKKGWRVPNRLPLIPKTAPFAATLCLRYRSSQYPDPALHPKLIVEYENR